MVLRLEVQNGSFAYGEKNVWENINLKIESNDILAILGPNGAGKTTLLKCMMNLLSFKTGTVLIDGKPIQDIPSKELWKQIAYVPQAKRGSSISVLDMIVLGRSSHISLFGQPKKEDYEKAESIIDSLNIRHFAHKNCNELSGGELQMVLIGRALINEPKLLIMDEPESNLDYRNQMRVLEIMKEVSKNTTCILNTHYPEHALRYANKALILWKNNSVFGNAKEIITEENLQSAFQIDVHIGEKMIGEDLNHFIIPLGLKDR